MNAVYVGYVVSKVSMQLMPVSVSTNSKKEAGELMEKWLQGNDNNGLDYRIGGVYTINDRDYIRLG